MNEFKASMSEIGLNCEIGTKIFANTEKNDR